MDFLYMVICEKLRAKGIVEKSVVMVVYAMITNGLTYEQARDFYAEFIGTSREQAQSGLCYATLRAGYDGMPGQILTEIAEEVKHEN